MKKKRVLRTDTLLQLGNAAKLDVVMAFVCDYRALAQVIGCEQWRLFFSGGALDKQHKDKTHAGRLGAAPLQMVRYQVVETLASWLANRQNEFRTCVSHSRLTDAVRHQLHAINVAKQWYASKPFVMHDGTVVDEASRKLARGIMRHVMGQHRRPNLGRLSPRLDVRVAALQAPTRATHADIWLKLRLPHRGSVWLPLRGHAHFFNRQGTLCNVVQLVTEDKGLTVRLVKDVTQAFEAQRKAYVPKIEELGLDFGLATLLATDRGDLLGRGLLKDLFRIDKQLTDIARHIMRRGLRPRSSKRYVRLVERLRGTLATRINGALNRVVAMHAPAYLVVEALRFSHPDLSRRMNRILTNCGRHIFNAKLKDLEDRFGIVTTVVHPAYTSRECRKCGYVDGRNRTKQAVFRCLWCHHEVHADVNAACTIKARRSRSLGTTPMHRGEILRVLVREHVERWPRPRTATPQPTRPWGKAYDPRWDNRYFREWASVARKELGDRVGPCAPTQ